MNSLHSIVLPICCRCYSLLQLLSFLLTPRVLTLRILCIFLLALSMPGIFSSLRTYCTWLLFRETFSEFSIESRFPVHFSNTNLYFIQALIMALLVHIYVIMCFPQTHKYVIAWALSVSVNTVSLEPSTVPTVLKIGKLMLSQLSFKWTGQIQWMVLLKINIYFFPS